VKKKFFWRIILIALIALISLTFFILSTPLSHLAPEWLRGYGLVLGLDLQGGVHLVYRVEGEKAVNNEIEKLSAKLRAILNAKEFKAEVKKEQLDIIITPSNSEIKSAVKDNYPYLTLADDSPDRLIYRLPAGKISEIKDSSVNIALQTINNRIDQRGVKEPTIRKQGTDEIMVQIPGVKDAEQIIELIQKIALLEFKLVDNESPIAAQLPDSVPPGGEEKVLQEFASRIPENDEILFGRVVDRETKEVIKKNVYLMKKEVLMTGEHLIEAKVSLENMYNEPNISMSFDDDGEKEFERITGENKYKNLAIILDNNVYSAPRIKEKISGGKAQIEGSFTLDEANDIAIALKSGSLKAPLENIHKVIVGPSLGRDSINAGILAGIIGSILVIGFMLFYYRFSGLIANFALVLNIVLLLGVLSVFNATLTMPGIAGIILAVGMAVDSNVLMFERIREELRVGKSPRAAIDSGYHKAFWTIFDSHVTTLITAVVLYKFVRSGPIKGFAVTLGVGIFINLFTALIGTKSIFDFITSRKDIKKLSI
jgi:preprotein translocase subunit SecD